jgi:hypothetical protein
MAENIDNDLLEILVCPVSKLPVVLEGGWLVCKDSSPQRRYPVKDNIPVMLVEKSEVLDRDGRWVPSK